MWVVLQEMQRGNFYECNVDLQFLHNSFMIFSPCFQKDMV